MRILLESYNPRKSDFPKPEEVWSTRKFAKRFRLASISLRGSAAFRWNYRKRTWRELRADLGGLTGRGSADSEIPEPPEHTTSTKGSNFDRSGFEGKL